MSRLSHLLVFLPITALAAGCATTSFATMEILDAPDDPPDRFLVGMPGSIETSEPEPGQGCRSPLVDPRDGTNITMVRSQGDLGDYAAPDGRYGTTARRLLRIECSTGIPIGIVRR